MVSANYFFSKVRPENIELFHRTKMPPEEPEDGIYSKLSSLLGAKFLI